MFAALPVLWSGFTGWITKNPIVMWIGGLLLVAIGWAKITGDIKEAAKKAERAANAQKQAETRAEMVERTSTIITEERHNADAALEARDSGSAPATYDELPDSHKAIAEGRARTAGPSSR